MAARFWTSILALQLAIGLAVAGLSIDRRLASPLAIALLAIAVAAGLATLAVGASFAMAAAATRASGRTLTTAAWCRAFLSELPHFGAAWLDMILEARGGDQIGTSPSGDRPRPVLLLHGLGCNRGIWRPLRARLHAAGWAPLWAINLQPPLGDLRPLVTSAAQALRLLARQAGGPVDVVAHSMGGLVARALLLVVEPQCIGCIVTIGTPHQGTVLARWLPSTGAQQMRPDSAWLRALNAAQAGGLPVPLISIYSLEDNIVAPASSAALHGAQLHALHGLGHFGLLRAPQGLDAVEAALNDSRMRRMHPP